MHYKLKCRMWILLKPALLFRYISLFFVIQRPCNSWFQFQGNIAEVSYVWEGMFTVHIPIIECVTVCFAISITLWEIPSLRFEAITATECSDILANHECQYRVDIWCFRDYVCLWHECAFWDKFQGMWNSERKKEKKMYVHSKQCGILVLHLFPH